MQTIFYTPPKSNFSVISNKLIRDENLSIGARMLAIFVLSLPKDFKLNSTFLAKNFHISTRTLQRYIKELIDSSYLIKQQAKNKDGSFNKFSLYIFIDENTNALFESLEEEEKQPNENTQETTQKDSSCQEGINETLERYTPQESEHLRRDADNKEQNKTQNTHFEHCDKKPHADFCPPYKINNIEQKNKNLLACSFFDKKILFISLKKQLKKKNVLNESYEGFLDDEVQEIKNFFAYRLERDKKLTPSTKKYILARLKSFKNEGYNIKHIIQTSILNSWQGLFKPKETKAQFSKLSTRFKSKEELSKEIISKCYELKSDFNIFNEESVKDLKIEGRAVLFDNKTYLYSLAEV